MYEKKLSIPSSSLDTEELSEEIDVSIYSDFVSVSVHVCVSVCDFECV